MTCGQYGNCKLFLIRSLCVYIADEQGRHLVYVSVYAFSELTLGLYQEGISLVKKILRQVKNFLVPCEDLGGGDPS